MRFFQVFFLFPVILSAVLLTAGCSSGKKQKSSAPSGKFMENEQPKQQADASSKGFFASERERRKEHEREFRDVRRCLVPCDVSLIWICRARLMPKFAQPMLKSDSDDATASPFNAVLLVMFISRILVATL